MKGRSSLDVGCVIAWAMALGPGLNPKENKKASRALSFLFLPDYSRHIASSCLMLLPYPELVLLLCPSQNGGLSGKL